MELLYQDRDMVACIKPVGVESEHMLPQQLASLLQGPVFPLHRLDQNVGGVMVFARSRKAAAVLSRTIAAGEMEKEYVAMVHGTPPEQGDWEDLLLKDSKRNKVFVVDRLRGGVKQARLTFTRLRAGETSLVRIRLHTGRSHQIRVQFSSRGYPLVGDHKYGARDQETAPMLFSCRISFCFRETPYTFEALPPWGEPPEREV